MSEASPGAHIDTRSTGRQQGCLRVAPLCQPTLPLLPPTTAPFPGTGQAHVLSPPPCRPAQRQPLLGGKGQQGHARIQSWLAASLLGELCKTDNFPEHQMLTYKVGCSRFPWWLSGKESACQCRRHRLDPWSKEIPYAVEPLSLCAYKY